MVKRILLCFALFVSMTASVFAYLPYNDIVLGGLAPGMPQEKVHQIYGTPETSKYIQFFKNNPYYWQETYDNGAFIVTYRNKNNVWRITSVETTEPNIFTVSGISVGMDIYELFNTYGKPMGEYIKRTTSPEIHGYNYMTHFTKDFYGSISFELQNDKIVRISIVSEDWADY